MNLYELRRIPSANKKYNWLYEIVIGDCVVYTHTSKKEYNGCYFNKDFNVYKFYNTEDPITMLNIIENTEHIHSNAITFEALKSLSKISH